MSAADYCSCRNCGCSIGPCEYLEVASPHAVQAPASSSRNGAPYQMQPEVPSSTDYCPCRNCGLNLGPCEFLEVSSSPVVQAPAPSSRYGDLAQTQTERQSQTGRLMVEKNTGRPSNIPRVPPNYPGQSLANPSSSQLRAIDKRPLLGNQTPPPIKRLDCSTCSQPQQEPGGEPLTREQLREKLVRMNPEFPNVLWRGNAKFSELAMGVVYELTISLLPDGSSRQIVPSLDTGPQMHLLMVYVQYSIWNIDSAEQKKAENFAQALSFPLKPLQQFRAVLKEDFASIVQEREKTNWIVLRRMFLRIQEISKALLNLRLNPREQTSYIKALFCAAHEFLIIYEGRHIKDCSKGYETWEEFANFVKDTASKVKIFSSPFVEQGYSVFWYDITTNMCPARSSYSDTNGSRVRFQNNESLRPIKEILRNYEMISRDTDNKLKQIENRMCRYSAVSSNFSSTLNDELTALINSEAVDRVELIVSVNQLFKNICRRLQKNVRGAIEQVNSIFEMKIVAAAALQDYEKRCKSRGEPADWDELISTVNERQKATRSHCYPYRR